MEEQPKGLTFADAEFQKVKDDAESFYKTIGSVYCPYFKEHINFNTEGIKHLKFKTWNKARPRNDQYMRLKLIHLASETVINSKTLQGMSEDKVFVRKKVNNRWDKILTDVFYYEFIAVIDRKRVKVIIKQTLGGEKFFWTLIPYWKTDGFSKRVLHEGNPETD